MKPLRYALVKTNWGTAAVVCSDRGVTRLIWPQRTVRQAVRQVQREAPGAAPTSPGRLPGRVTALLADYFAGRPVDFSAVPVDLSDQPPFGAKVLAKLRRIGYGCTTTYGQLARRVGRPRAARAVGQAVGANPAPVIVPCHRVLGCGGRLGGFSAPGGVATKSRLLALERARAKDGIKVQKVK